MRPLDRFFTRVEGGQVEIGPRYSVNSEFKRFPSYRDPAQTLDGHRPVRLPRTLLDAQAGPKVNSTMPKLPALPPLLSPRPKRPGEAEKVKPLDQAKEAGIHAADWIDERTSLSGALRWVMFRKVPKGTNWFYTFGSATMFAFLSQAVTGVFLAMYYTPSVTDAYESTRRITNEVFLGEFVRGMHKWGSTIMVILIFLHMGRVFFFGAYKYPREMNWIIGFVLLLLHVHHVADRLPAAVRPALVLGDDRGRQHHRFRTDRGARTWATSCAAARSSARRRCRASTRSTCCSCQARSRR